MIEFDLMNSTPLPWGVIKKNIASCQTNPKGFNLIEKLDTELPTYYQRDKLLSLMQKCNQSLICNIELAKKLQDKLAFLDKMVDSYTIRNPWYGILSVKLIISGRCQANCRFCYVNKKDYGKQCVGVNEFNIESNCRHIAQTLHKIASKAHGRPMSLDITGGEPTYFENNLKVVMRSLKSEGVLDLFKRVTLTSNGYNLENMLRSEKMADLGINYLNISLHSDDFAKRKGIFGTEKIPNDNDLNYIVNEMYAQSGVRTSAVFVIDDFNRLDFEDFERMNAWAESMGFVSARWRSDVFNPKALGGVEIYSDMLEKVKKYKLCHLEKAADSVYSIFCRDGDFLVYLLEGNEDPAMTSLGLVVVVRGDGEAFLDSSCSMNIDDFPHLSLKYVFDKKEV